MCDINEEFGSHKKQQQQLFYNVYMKKKLQMLFVCRKKKFNLVPAFYWIWNIFSLGSVFERKDIVIWRNFANLRKRKIMIIKSQGFLKIEINISQRFDDDDDEQKKILRKMEIWNPQNPKTRKNQISFENKWKTRPKKSKTLIDFCKKFNFDLIIMVVVARRTSDHNNNDIQKFRFVMLELISR